MDILKKAGLMTQHLDLLSHMQDLRGLLQLAAHMEERGDRAALITAEQLTLIGQESRSESSVTSDTLTTSKGAVIAAPVIYRLMAHLKGFEDEEYTVNRRELAALNSRAVAELESSDALRAFAETLGRIEAARVETVRVETVAQAPAAQVTSPETATPEATERPGRRNRPSETAEGAAPDKMSEKASPAA